MKGCSQEKTKGEGQGDRQSAQERFYPPFQQSIRFCVSFSTKQQLDFVYEKSICKEYLQKK